MGNIGDEARRRQILSNFKLDIAVTHVPFQKSITDNDLLEKAINRGNLQLKQITDKNGKSVRRWVDPNDKEHMEHGTHASFEHNGEKKTGKVGRVSSSGRYVVHGDDGTIYKKHPMELQKHDGGKPATANKTDDSNALKQTFGTAKKDPHTPPPKDKSLPKGVFGVTRNGHHVGKASSFSHNTKGWKYEDHMDAAKIHRMEAKRDKTKAQNKYNYHSDKASQHMKIASQMPDDEDDVKKADSSFKPISIDDAKKQFPYRDKSGLINSTKNVQKILQKVSNIDRFKLTESLIKEIKTDSRKASLYQKYKNHDSLKSELEYLQKTGVDEKEIKVGKTSVSVSTNGNLSINGKQVLIDDASGSVTFSGSKMQGIPYTHATTILRNRILSGETFKDIDDYMSKKWKSPVNQSYLYPNYSERVWNTVKSKLGI